MGASTGSATESTGSGDETEDPYGDSGDGGGSFDNVINLIQDTCRNAALNAISAIGINNTISQFYNAVSSSSSPITMVFTESSSLSGPAYTLPMELLKPHSKKLQRE